MAVRQLVGQVVKKFTSTHKSCVVAIYKIGTTISYLYIPRGVYFPGWPNSRPLCSNHPVCFVRYLSALLRSPDFPGNVPFVSQYTMEQMINDINSVSSSPFCTLSFNTKLYCPFLNQQSFHHIIWELNTRPVNLHKYVSSK